MNCETLLQWFGWNAWTLRLTRFMLGLILVPVVIGWTQAQDVPIPNSAAVLKGHSETVYSLLFHPSGKQVVTGSFDKSIKVWDVQSGREIRTFAGSQGHQQMVLSLDISPDGTMIASGSTDNTMKIWDYPSSGPIWKKALGDSIESLNSTQDGKTLAAGMKDGSIQVYKNLDPKEGPKNPTILKGHSAPVTQVQIVNNGQNLVSAGNDGMIHTWNLADGKMLSRIGAHEGGVGALWTSNTSQVISAGNDGSIKIWNPQAKSSHVGEYQVGNKVVASAISPDGALIAVATDKSEIQLLQGDTWKKSRDLEVKDVVGVKRLAISADKKWLLGSQDGGIIHLWNLNDGKQVLRRQFANESITNIGFTPTLGQYFVAGGNGGIRLFQAPQAPITQPVNFPEPLKSAFSMEDGKRFAWLGNSGQVRLSSGETVGTPIKSELTEIAVFDASKTLWAGFADGTIRNLASTQKDAAIEAHKGRVVGIGVGQGVLVSVGEDKAVRTWKTSAFESKDPKRGVPAFEKILASKPVTMRFQPGKSLVWVGSEDGKLTAIQLQDGKIVWESKVESGPVRTVSISRDGSTLICLGDQGVAHMLDIQGLPGQPAKEIRSVATGKVAHACLAPDGKMAAYSVAGAPSPVIGLLDVVSGVEVCRIPLPLVPMGVQFQQDKKNISVIMQNQMISLETGFEKVIPGKFVAMKPNGILSMDNAGVIEVKALAPLAQTGGDLQVSRDVTLAALCLDKTVKVVKLDDGKEIWSLSHPQKVLSSRVSSDKAWLASLCEDGKVRVWDLKAGRQVQFHDVGGVDEILDFHPQNTAVIALGKDRKVHGLPIVISRTIPANTLIRTLVMIPNQQLLAGACDDKSIRIWNIGTGNQEKEFISSGNALRALAYAPNGQMLAVGGLDPEIRVYQASDQKLIGSIKANGAIRSLSFPKDQVLAAASEDGSINLYSVPFSPGQQLSADFGKKIQGFEVGNLPTSFIVQKEGKAIYSTDTAGNLQEFRIASDSPLKNISQPGFVDAVAFDPKGALVATGCHDGKIRIIDVAKGNTVKEIEAHNKPAPLPVYSVLWSPDGKRIYSSAMNGSIKAHDTSSGALIFEIKPYAEKDAESGHKEGVFSLAMHPGKNFLASAGSDRVIKVWNLQDGKFIRNLTTKGADKGKEPVSNPGWIYSIKFVADGSKLVASGAAPRGRGKISVWNVADGVLSGSFEVASGVVYSTGILPGSSLVGYTSGTGKPGVDTNPAFIVPLPGVK